MFSKYTSRQLESHWIGFKKYLPQNILELTILRFLLGWLGTFYYSAQLYLLCIVFIFFLTTHYFWGIKGTRAGWQVHLDSGPMPQGEKEQHFILIIQQTICIIP